MRYIIYRYHKISKYIIIKVGDHIDLLYYLIVYPPVVVPYGIYGLIPIVVGGYTQARRPTNNLRPAGQKPVLDAPNATALLTDELMPLHSFIGNHNNS